MELTKFDSKLQLTNDGNLQCFFVGTGSAFSKENFQSNMFVIKGKDHILIDCGNIFPYALLQYNTSIAEIKNLFITHAHADHAGGLEELAFSGLYSTKIRPKIIITDEYKKILWENTISGGCACVEDGSKAQFMTFDDYFEQQAPEQIKKAPRPFYKTKIGSIDIKIFRTKHLPLVKNNWKKSFYSFGLLIDERIIFTGDTMLDTELLTWLTNEYPVEYIFHDCQLYPGGIHTYYGDLKNLPSSLKEKMILYHYGDEFAKFAPEKDGFIGFAKRGVYYNF